MSRVLCLSLAQGSFLVAMVALVFMAAPVLAEVEAKTGYVEGGAGYFLGDGASGTFLGQPARAEIENSLMVGGRGGMFFTNNWGLEGWLAYSPAEVTRSASALGSGIDDMAILFLDASAVYCLNPSGEKNVLLLGGIGYMQARIEGFNSQSSPTLHLGAAAKLFRTESFYIRPDVRYLYVDGVDFGFDGGKKNQLNSFALFLTIGVESRRI
ncbi:MAG: outer membrane beta-barrel protein [Acidobacteriota bacterium]|nr:MAG: outer membrane beta-barrel protein [Acidobacteriota bacterium]